MRRIVLAAAICLPAGPAFAHAFLQKATPPVGAQLTNPPTALTLTYTEPVEPLFSSVQVTDSGGTAVTAGKPAASGDGRTLTVGLKPLADGTYQVEWHVTSVDTHKTEGHFTFTVRH